MSEMIERVARAICRSNLDDPDEILAHVADRPFPRWHRHLPESKAAIAAMREPTDTMVRLGCDEYSLGDPDQYPSKSGITDAWRAMIDEALK